MPNDVIVEKDNLQLNWGMVEHAINTARRTEQSGSDVWSVVSFDGVYMGTVWSRPRVNGGATNHAEDRFFGEYSLNMLGDFIDKYRRWPDVLRLSIKYSPCNKDNDDREDRCTIKIANDKQFWGTIQVRYWREYTNPDHDMGGSRRLLSGGGISSGFI